MAEDLKSVTSKVFTFSPSDGEDNELFFRMQKPLRNTFIWLKSKNKPKPILRTNHMCTVINSTNNSSKIVKQVTSQNI